MLVPKRFFFVVNYRFLHGKFTSWRNFGTNSIDGDVLREIYRNKSFFQSGPVQAEKKNKETNSKSNQKECGQPNGYESSSSKLISLSLPLLCKFEFIALLSIVSVAFSLRFCVCVKNTPYSLNQPKEFINC